MAAVPKRHNQYWEKGVEPATGIAENGDTSGRQRLRVTARDGGDDDRYKLWFLNKSSASKAGIADQVARKSLSEWIPIRSPALFHGLHSQMHELSSETMATGAAINRQIHCCFKGSASSANGLPVKTNLSNRTTIHCQSDQKQTVGVGQTSLKPVVVIT